MARRPLPFLAILLTLALVAITVAMILRGSGFYGLSLEDRVEHPDFRVLRPTGRLGSSYGWMAAMLVVLNLSYLVRRRFGGLGSMRVWLDLHVFTGLTATSLVAFHSAFQLRTPIATVSAASLVLVVLTGLIGRFLYALAPTSGRERLRVALDAIAAAQPETPDARDTYADAIGAIPGPEVPANASLLRSVLAIPRWRTASARRRSTIARLLPPRRERTRELARAAKELATAAAAEARASGTAALLRSWRGLHRFFALLMLAAVLLHAGVAWYYGYRFHWIFEGA